MTTRTLLRPFRRIPSRAPDGVAQSRIASRRPMSVSPGVLAAPPFVDARRPLLPPPPPYLRVPAPPLAPPLLDVPYIDVKGWSRPSPLELSQSSEEQGGVDGSWYSGTGSAFMRAFTILAEMGANMYRP